MSPARSRRPPAFPERGFHRWLANLLPAGATGRLPIGDDVAAIPFGRGRSLLLTTDCLSEGTHFLAASSPETIGRATINASLSDLAAKGGRPIAALLDLLLPPRTPLQWARGVVKGAEAAAHAVGCHVVGGDTKPASGRSVVGTLVGWGGPRLAPRSAARPGDLLVVTGTVGRGGANAIPLTRGTAPDRRALRDLLEIRPRLREGRWLVQFAHAMLDTSDGIGEAARLLAAASRVRVVLEPDRFPLDPRLARAQGSAPWAEQLAFFGGDYELLAAVPRTTWARMPGHAPRATAPFTVVGRVERGAGAWEERAGRVTPIRHMGWDPFARPRPLPART